MLLTGASMTYGSDFVLILFWLCYDFVLTLFWPCSDLVLILFWLCTNLILTLFWPCSPWGVDPLRSRAPWNNQGLGRPFTSKLVLSKVTIHPLSINKFNFWGEGGVRLGVEKKRKGTEREVWHEGLYQISDQSVHKQLRKLHSKWYGDGQMDGPTDKVSFRGLTHLRLTLLRPVGGPPLKQTYGCFRGYPPAVHLACGIW
jgi:hypothetical protein